MNASTPSFAVLLESFFIERLMKQKQASSHTIKSYRDTFRLLLKFIQNRICKSPSKLELADIDAPLVADFLCTMEKDRKISARSRNLRLTAIRSFFRYAAFEVPSCAAQIQRVLAIPAKRHDRAVISFLTKPEAIVLLAAPNQQTWSGRRDHALLMVAIHTGLRCSELTALLRRDVVLGTGSHVRVTGKGRKERCTPLSKLAVQVLRNWLHEPVKGDSQVLFPNAHGGRLSGDGVQYILRKHLRVASQDCLSLKQKKITPHSLRHGCAMELLQAGVDRAVIALWLGHESVETTQIYLHANLAMKEAVLAKIEMPQGKVGRYRPDDQLLDFLSSL